MSTLALVHPTDLVAVELRRSLDRRRDLWERLLLLSSSEDEIGTLTEVRGAAAMVEKMEPGSFEGVDVAFFSASMAANRPLIEDLPAATAVVVLSTDSEPGDGHPIVAGVNLGEANREAPMISPHPATVVLAHLLHPLLGFVPRLAAATVLQPVSMHGKAGLDEMFEQTRSILSFADDPPRDVFPIQMVFNAVPASTPATLLERQLAAVLGTGTPAAGTPAAGTPAAEMPLSIHLLQVGIFHGFSASVYLELAEDPGPEAVRRALGEHPVNELVQEADRLGPIDAAARDQVLIGAIDPVAGGPGRYRLWAVMDNLTCGGALNALQILEAISNQVTH